MSAAAEGLSLVVPMFNESEGIGEMISHVRKTLPNVCSRWEAVFVDDGSSDGTADAVAAWARKDARIRLVRLERRSGYGSALRAGFAAARYGTAAYTDADKPCDLLVLKEVLPLAGSDALVACFRTARKESWLRTMYSRAYNTLIRICFGLRVRDVNFSLKVCERRVLEGFSLSSRGSFIDVELLLAARAAGLRIRQYPIEYLPRRFGCSTLSSWRVIGKILLEMAAHGRRHPTLRALGAAERVISRYRVLGWRDRFHVRGRWMFCPFEILESFVPGQGRVLDYGCGHGMFGHLLQLSSSQRRVIGYDPDIRKIKAARRSASGIERLSFTSDDPLEKTQECYAAIILADVLPYLSKEEGCVLLGRCVKRLEPGGVLLIKEVTRRAWMSFLLIRLHEWVMVSALGWTWSARRRSRVWEPEELQAALAGPDGESEAVALGRGPWNPHVIWRRRRSHAAKDSLEREDSPVSAVASAATGAVSA